MTHTIAIPWPPERVQALAAYLGGRVVLARRSRLSYTQITRLITPGLRIRPHAGTVDALKRVARESRFPS